MWHLLQVDDLAARPFAPLWDVHTTPPLFNVAVGAVLRYSPLSEAHSFRLLFVAGALFGAVALCQILRAVGVRWWLAALVATVVYSKPSLLSAETYVSHESFVTPYLMGTVWAVAAYARRPSLGRYGLVLAAATLLVMTRALFSPVWLVAVVAAMLVMRRPPGDLRRLAIVTALPVLVIVGVMAKNQVRFGTFMLSSWAGMNLSRTTITPLGVDRIEEMIADGELSPMARIQWFSPYGEYEELMGPCDTDFGIAALDDPLKDESTTGRPVANYNAACYVPVYQQAMEDSLAAIRHEPGIYARAVRANGMMYLSDIDRSYNLGRLEGPTAGVLTRGHDVLGLEYSVVVQYPNIIPLPADVQLTSALALVVVGVAGLRAVRRRAHGTSTDGDLVVVVVAVTVVMVTLLGVTFDAFENGRFREPLDPLLLGAVFGGGLEWLARAVDRRRAAGAGPAPDPH